MLGTIEKLISENNFIEALSLINTELSMKQNLNDPDLTQYFESLTSFKDIAEKFHSENCN